MDARELTRKQVALNGRLIKEDMAFLKELKESIIKRIDDKLQPSNCQKSVWGFYTDKRIFVGIRENSTLVQYKSFVVYGNKHKFHEEITAMAEEHVTRLGFKVLTVTSCHTYYIKLSLVGFSPLLSAKWRGLVRFIIVCNRYRKDFYDPNTTGKGYELARTNFEAKRAKLE